MSNICQIIPHKNRPLHIQDLDHLDTLPDNQVEIPLLGDITAGQPIDCVEQNETIRVPANMVRKNCYALRVSGHSMIDDNIQDGDVIVVEKRATAENGQSVVAMINGEQVTLKKFYIEAGGIRLQPANPDMEPIYLKNEEVEVLGVVAGVIRQF